MPGDRSERWLRRLGASLSAVGLLAALAGAGWLVVSANPRAGQMAIGGLVTGLVGAMLLLLAPDRLPPGEHP